MFLSFKALTQSGVEVRPHNDGVELLPTVNWSREAIEYFDNLTTELSLDDHDRDTLSDTISDLTLMRTIKGCLTPRREERVRKAKTK